MKPDFALDFRNEQITLLHRQEAGWALVGRVAMDDPDLDAALGYLRATALGLSPRGISAKLILPNDAILYTTVRGLPAQAAQRAVKIAEGLIGRTPYRVDDLVYDWIDDGQSAHVAVIARETLIEAEGFATQHRFNPVSFAAMPEDGASFVGEAWFGATELAQTLLARGEVVERDTATAVKPSPAQNARGVAAPAQAAGAGQASSADFEMGAKPDAALPVPPDLDTASAATIAAATIAAPAVADSTVAEPDGALAAQPLNVSPDAPASDQQAQIDLQSEWEDAPEGVDLADEGASPSVAAEGDSAVLMPPADAPPAVDVLLPDAPTPQMSGPDLSGPDQTALPDQSAIGAPAAASEPAVPDASAQAVELPASFDAAMAELDAAPDQNSGEAAAAASDEAPMALDVPLIEEELASTPRTVAKTAAELEIGAKAEGLLAAFAARRSAALAKTLDQTPPADSQARPEPVFAARSDGTIATAVDASPQNGAPEQMRAAPTDAPSTPKLGPAGALGAATRPLAPMKPGMLKPAPVVHVPAKIAFAAQAQNIKSMPKAKPAARFRIGLGWVLTAALLVSLMAAAAMSSYLMAGFNTFINGDTRLAAVPELADQPQAAALPAQSHAMLAEVGTMLDQGIASGAGADAGVTAGLAAEQADPTPSLKPAAAQPAPPLGQDLMLATRAPDVPVPAVDTPAPTAPAPTAPAASTPAPASPNPEILAAAAPDLDVMPAVPAIAAGQGAALGGTSDDSDDIVLASLNQTDVTVPVIEGAPPVVPAPRPVAQVATPQTILAEPAAAPSFAADPALANLRPAPRPVLTPPDTPPQDTQASTALPLSDAVSEIAAPASDPALAGARPLARPTGAIAAAQQARQASASASLVAGAQAAVTEALADTDPAGTSDVAANLGPLNVGISRLPAARPAGLAQDFAARAAAAAAAPPPAAPQQAAQQPEQAPAEAAVETAALEAVDEPEDVTGAAPSRSVVARQATQRNVLVMNDAALVGIFGNQAGRYALVRQPNGRFRKLKVGDNFDGGQVAAITESELRLAKGGQMVAMKMPRG